MTIKTRRQGRPLTAGATLLVVSLCLASPAMAQEFVLECKMSVYSQETIATSQVNRDDEWDFPITGRFRVDPTARSVVAEFTVNVKDESTTRESRYFSDVRAIDAAKVVFCEDEDNRCTKQTQPGNDSWRVFRPTVIDLANMTISTKEEYYYTGRNSSYATGSRKITGTCRRL